MIKKLSFFFMYILFVGLIGCSKQNTNHELPTIHIETNSETLNTDEEPKHSEPKHSELYVEDYSTFQILTYFEEVVLNMEYSDGTGDVACVQKWLSPIYYRLYGPYTDSDMN